MPTSTAASAALTLAPVSAKAAELLHALYADALAAAEASVQPPIGTIVLQPPPSRLNVRFGGNGSMYLESREFRRDGTSVWRYHDVDGPNYFGEEVRRDSAGREWSRSFCATVDDFGDLVEVPR